MWRTVSFVERVEVEFKGNLFNQALILADVDNDKRNELIVGNVEGDLAIFKGSNPVTCRRGSDLGMITCIGVGDFCNKGRNILVCLTAEGTCYLFDVKPETENELTEEEKILKPSFKQELPANSKVLLLADIGGEGEIELIVGYSDRIIRTFKWVPGSDSDGTGRIVFVQKWQLAGQTETITVNKSENGSLHLMASQPGGTLVTLLPHSKGSNSIKESSPSKTGSSPSSHEHGDTFILYHPLGLSRAKNRDISTVIVGNINIQDTKENSHSTYYAVATLDGNLVLAEDDRIIWSLQVDHQLFSLSKLDVTGNGQEEVVCCSWDGQTYIVNHSREVVRYLFQENVSAFSAGFYSLSDRGRNLPCFVYATFNNTIYIYHNINLPRVESTNLIQVMNRIPETHNLLSKLNINKDRTDQLQELYHWCLYGYHNK